MANKPLSREFLLKRGYCCKNGCVNCPYKSTIMPNQFVYTRKEITGGTAEAPEFKEFKESFNINMVIRSVAMEDGRLLVLLDDLHERAQMVPDVDPKTNKIKGYKRERNTYQSEIYLEGDDVKRFLDTL